MTVPTDILTRWVVLPEGIDDALGVTVICHAKTAGDYEQAVGRYLRRPGYDARERTVNGRRHLTWNTGDGHIITMCEPDRGGDANQRAQLRVDYAQREADDARASALKARRLGQRPDAALQRVWDADIALLEAIEATR